eukprot:SAG11_NODE_11450_length_759_cov_4.784382_1_plen_74_part_00
MRDTDDTIAVVSSSVTYRCVFELSTDSEETAEEEASPSISAIATPGGEVSAGCDAELTVHVPALCDVDAFRPP